MRWTLITTTLAAAAVLATPAVLAQEDSGVPFRLLLDGESEAPGPGDPDGTGTATFRINPGQEELCYTLTVQNIAPATAAHIHLAPAGVPGPVIIGLAAPTSGSSGACIPISREGALLIIRNPQDYYVNVHNAEFPAGAIRAQLSD